MPDPLPPGTVCPVCGWTVPPGYPALPYCPACGFDPVWSVARSTFVTTVGLYHHGVLSAHPRLAEIIADYRRAWISLGMPWFGPPALCPPGWDPHGVLAALLSTY